MDQQECFKRLGIDQSDVGAIAVGADSSAGTGAEIVDVCPIDGAELCRFRGADAASVARAAEAASETFLAWRRVPAPVRGEFVRQFGNVLREEKVALGYLVTLEVGKILQEGLGEVQEMIDICDFAVGLSRQLDGRVMASERKDHRLTEQWHPLGPIGVISAFNFPVAVWAWNAAIAWVAGDPVVWKPSEKAPLCALACHNLAERARARMGDVVPQAVSSVLVGGSDVGRALAENRRLALISATGSIPMGRAVGQVVAERLGRSLLELGGNNAVVVAPSADRELALRGIVFSAVGTAGQRCTSLRRMIIHETIADAFVARLKGAYSTLPIGDPRRSETLVGPLIDASSADAMARALEAARGVGAVIFGGERVTEGVPAGGAYVRPAIVEIAHDAPIVHTETFAPILYVHRYSEFSDAIAINNEVPQGLSSAIFTRDMREAELFCSARGSDCGIVNVNIGTSGAEIGGAFGGEKETGGGRESGSDAWKAYMRRVTNTVNFSSELPLAQGIQFDVPSG